eukprot:evm.model.NODE_5293_length_1094_cov_25.739489.1
MESLFVSYWGGRQFLASGDQGGGFCCPCFCGRRDGETVGEGEREGKRGKDEADSDCG